MSDAINRRGSGSLPMAVRHHDDKASPAGGQLKGSMPSQVSPSSVALPLQTSGAPSAGSSSPEVVAPRSTPTPARSKDGAVTRAPSPEPGSAEQTGQVANVSANKKLVDRIPLAGPFVDGARSGGRTVITGDMSPASSDPSRRALRPLPPAHPQDPVLARTATVYSAISEIVVDKETKNFEMAVNSSYILGREAEGGGEGGGGGGGGGMTGQAGHKKVSFGHDSFKPIELTSQMRNLHKAMGIPQDLTSDEIRKLRDRIGNISFGDALSGTQMTLRIRKDVVVNLAPFSAHIKAKMDAGLTTENGQFLRHLDVFERTPSVRAARTLFNKYIPEKSKNEINLSDQLRTKIRNALEAAERGAAPIDSLFDAARAEIRQMMDRDFITWREEVVNSIGL